MIFEMINLNRNYKTFKELYTLTHFFERDHQFFDAALLSDAFIFAISIARILNLGKTLKTIGYMFKNLSPVVPILPFTLFVARVSGQKWSGKQ